MTELLQDLYQPYNDRFARVTKKFEKNGLTGPVLMSPEKTAYRSQQTKLLIINTEIRGWIYRGWDIKTHMENYSRLSEEGGEGDCRFWKSRAEFEKVFDMVPGSSAWTSLGKFSFPMSALDCIYRDEIEQFDELLMGELVYLKPDVVVFMTGHENDNRLRRLLEGMKMKKADGFQSEELMTMHHIFLPKRSFRVGRALNIGEGGVYKRVLEFIKSV